MSKNRLNGYGPGSQLLAIYEAAGISGCNGCKGLAIRMDAWGVEGCRERIEQIVTNILPRAKQWIQQNKPILDRWTPDAVKEPVMKMKIKGDVLEAIRLAEAAQESGLLK